MLAREPNFTNEVCKFCLKDTIKLIKEFFYYADKRGDGLLNAEELFNAVYNLKIAEKVSIPVDSTQINDFMLKVMEPNSTTINLNEFVYVILCGFMERNFSAKGGSDIEMNQ